MALTEDEKSRILIHLGFAGVDTFTTATGPLVSVVTYRTNAEAQLEHLNATGEARIRTLLLPTMDALEARMVKAQRRLAVSQLGEITLRKTEISDLEREIRRWGVRIAETLGCNPNPYAERYSGGGCLAPRATG
jgi:hypothetical protein